MITLTDSAASKVKELLEAEGAIDLALRVAVRPGGCSGFSYEMFFDGDIAADDQQAQFGQDDQRVQVVVDPASAADPAPNAPTLPSVADRRERCCVSAKDQLNDWPHPQVRVAFGFVMANPAWFKPSL